MKSKILKRRCLIGIGTTVGLSTLALSACAPILVSCSNNDGTIIPSIEIGTNKIDENTEFKNGFSNFIFWNTLTDLYDKYTGYASKNVLMHLIKSDNGLAKQITSSSEKISVKDLYKICSYYDNSPVAENKYAVKYLDPAPLLECKVDTKNKNKLNFNFFDFFDNVDFNKYSYKEYVKFGIALSSILAGWWTKSETNNKYVQNENFNKRNADNTFGELVHKSHGIVDEDIYKYVNSFKVNNKKSFSLTIPELENNDSNHSGNNENNKLNGKYVFKNGFSNNEFWNTLLRINKDYETDPNTNIDFVLSMHKSDLGRIVTYSRNISINDLYKLNSSPSSNDEHRNMYYKFSAKNIQRTRIEYYHDPVKENKIIFKVYDQTNIFNTANFDFKEFIKFQIIDKAIYDGWKDEQGNIPNNAHFNKYNAEEKFNRLVELINNNFLETSQYNFLNSFKAIDEQTFSLTFTKKSNAQ